MIQSLMIKTITKETLYFIIILSALALLQHPDLLSAPMTRIENIIQNGNYLHPLLWSLGLYLIIGILRIIFKSIVGLKKRLKNKS